MLQSKSGVYGRDGDADGESNGTQMPKRGF